MTAAPKGGGVRALGASLLDQVLAETLDPAYVQAAEARARRNPDGDARRAGGRSSALVAVTLLVTGLLLALAYNQAAAGSQGREEIRAALVRDIQRESATGEELAARVEEQEAELVATREHLLESTLQGQQALDRLERASTGAAAVPVTGPGLLITLADPEPDADSDPVGGQDPEDPRGKVRDGDLQRVVNALWGAGAEAVSVNGHRLGPTTAIRTAGEAVLVEFRPVTNPYEIRAVGDPGRMAEEFLLDADVRALGTVSRAYGMRFEYAQVDDLELPAAPVAELRLARPVGDSAAEAAAAGSQAPTAPGEPRDGTPGAAP